MRLNLVAWQFVRVMTWLENAGNRRNAAAAALFDAWSERWGEIDATLDELGAEDPDAFSEMMMHYLVTLELPPPVQEGRTTMIAAVNGVIAELEAALREEPEDEVLAQGLAYERDAMKALAKRLSAMSEAPARSRNQGRRGRSRR